MVAVSTIAFLDLLAGVLAAVGLLYLLYSDTTRVHYRRFFRLIAVGMLSYAVTGPIVGTLAPAAIHAVHTVAVLFVTLGLYDLVRVAEGDEIDFETVLRTDDATSGFERGPSRESQTGPDGE